MTHGNSHPPTHMTAMADQDSKTSRSYRPVVLCILDGWGERAEHTENAIALADTPNWDRFKADCPHSLLQASADEVGLPEGQMGNSEVGHMNLGAGRVVLQDLPRIDEAIANAKLEAFPAMKEFIAKMTNSGGACHLLGLLSPGGVHSHQRHIAALARILSEAGVPVRVHAFLDGRDTPPRSAAGYMREFLDEVRGLDGVSVAVVSGRYYAMDRDKRWDRVAKGHGAVMNAVGERVDDPVAAIEASYGADVSDEFMVPVVVGDYAGMADGDGILMANFRSDRAREILTSLVDPAFADFERQRDVKFAALLGMVSYSDALDPLFPALFPPQSPTEVLGELVAEAGLKQLRIAETEKYAHVTFFFNGGRESVFDGEERILIPSPKVATYDLQPEMSAPEVTDKLVAAIDSATFDLVVVNYANGDMVGHTGNLDAAKKAAEALDHCLGRLAEAVGRAGGVLLITADHGNAEMMQDPDTHERHTAHTMNPVPFIVVGPERSWRVRNGRLADVAPTVLRLMGLPKAEPMTGTTLIDEGTTASLAAQ